jgi:hypothetical protein
MKSIFILLTLISLLSIFGCSTYEFINNNGYAIISSDKPNIYHKYTAEKVGTLDKRKGDTVQTFGFRYDKNWEGYIYDTYSLVGYNSDTVLVFYKQIFTFKEHAIDQTPKKFIVKKSEDEVKWSRAYNYIYKNSDLKIQVNTQYSIETYNNFKYTQTAFRITKMLINNDEYEYEVYSNKDDAAKRCSYFIQTGQE